MATEYTANKALRSEGKFALNKLALLSRGWDVVFNAVLWSVALLVVIPVALIVMISFSSEASIANVGYSLFPSEFSLKAYDYIFKIGRQLGISYVMTFFYTAGGTALSLVVSTMFAYVICQKNFKARKGLTWYMFITMMFSGGLVPSYILQVNYLGMGDTVWVFLLSGTVNAYNIIILRTFIRTTIPESIFESSRLEGAGHFRVFLQMVLPLSKAGIATIALFNVVARWNDWFTGMLYVTNDPNLVPLQTMLIRLQNQLDFLKSNAQAAATPDGMEMLRNLPNQSLRMSCTIAVILPILLAYPFFQRYFISGLTLGSIKE
jgi:putative aldouronate transport system permease protein